MTFEENIELNGIGLIVSGDYEHDSGTAISPPCTTIFITSVVVADLDVEIYPCIDKDMEQRIKELIEI